jgi:hypothetical protein
LKDEVTNSVKYVQNIPYPVVKDLIKVLTLPKSLVSIM